MKVLVAMSGGVDSSVAAALMLEAGHEVVGVTLKQWEGPDGEMPTAGCCTVADAEDARRVSAQLGIPYYMLDYTDEFRTKVIDRFGADYVAGRTPNPCIECNRRVRFSALLERSSALGCEALVTGHHARVRRHPEGYRLFAGRDSGKDQSYVLHMLGQTELARVLLPIGELTKDEVRAKASALGLRTATKPDSQDICFVTSGDYRDFLREHFPESTRPGDIVDGEGSVVGSHRGAAGFTIGQRRGLGISAAEPRYVVDIRPATATIVVGTRDELAVAGVRITEVSWVSGHPPAHLTVDLKVRYRSRPVPALIEGAGGEWTAWFDGESAAPGQAAVLYNGDEVLGGGTITEVIRNG